MKEEIFRVAKRYGTSVTLVSSRWIRVPEEPWLTLVVVKDTGRLDVADDWIVRRVRRGDLVVTEDIILAGRSLDRGALALNSRGRVFTRESIREAVATREILSAVRGGAPANGSHRPYDKRDRSAFLQRLDELMQRALRG